MHIPPSFNVFEFNNYLFYFSFLRSPIFDCARYDVPLFVLFYVLDPGYLILAESILEYLLDLADYNLDLPFPYKADPNRIDLFFAAL